ncbi:MAG: arylamine N-acetyltransferase [Anaerolineales bacterium]|nr:arylamine N-acetyltransferase [Anaerolineales bacterium]
MDIHAYLNRIQYQGSVLPNYETLRGLHLAHMRSVPFENLDIALKRPIRMDEASLWEKIVVHGRGGFCYELNGLFAWLLKQIGFDVTYLNGRVFNKEGKRGIEFDHLALLITIPNSSTRWLADVGFGDSFTEPLAFEERGEQTQSLRAYRLEEVTDGFVTWRKKYDGAWERQYFFDALPRTFPQDYEAGCLYHQTSPNSSFTQQSVISRATDDGRVTLEDDLLIITKNGQRTKQPFESQDEYHRLLKEYFGIVLQKEIV